MHSEQIIIDSVLALWKSNVDRATRLFDDLSEEDAAEPVAPGRNRVVYLLGHLTAVHDRMIPLLGLGERVHPEMDATFVTKPDRAAGDLPPLADLKSRWENVNRHLLVLMQQDLSPSWWAQRHTSVSEADFQINPTRNRLSILLNRTNHLSFHLGQIVLAPSRMIAPIPSDTSASVSRHNPPTMWDMASLGFSHISVAEPGRLAFLSGQIAATPGSGEVPEDLPGQAKLATASLAAGLKELGASAQDIVMLRVYVVNATSEAFGQAVTPLRELYGDVMPSITTIGVQALYKPEIKVEIEMVVRLPWSNSLR